MSIAVRVESFRELNSFSRSSRKRVCVRVCLLVVFLFTSTSLSLSVFPSTRFHAILVKIGSVVKESLLKTVCVPR